MAAPGHDRIRPPDGRAGARAAGTIAAGQSRFTTSSPVLTASNEVTRMR
jgi:hypothetical protein